MNLGFHKKISFVKSGIRIVACMWGFSSIKLLLIGLIAAEILGIVEEMFEDN